MADVDKGLYAAPIGVEEVAENEEAKKLLGIYLAPMANQNLTEEEARLILEYFRTVKAK